jgi:hypothetical protein
MSVDITHYCDMQDCHEKALEYLELPDMVVKAYSTDGHGTIIVRSVKRRFDICQKHMTDFMNSSFVKDASVAREKKVVQG